MQRARTSGVPVVLSSPSGGGKTTLCRRVMAELGGVEFSVSYTTRPPRGAERDGIDYHFVDDPTFDAMIRDGALLEWAEVHGRRYGTGRADVLSRLEAGVDVLFDIDVQGGRQIAERLAGAVLVFVLPPSMEILEERLRRRASDSAEQVQRRLAAAREEMGAAVGLYDYWIVNDDLERAAGELTCILRAERLRRVDGAALVARLGVGGPEG